jgi:DNA-binding MarR family transcriptional regulator
VPTKKESYYLAKLEWLGPILVRGLRLLSSVEALGQEFSFSQTMVLQALIMNRQSKMSDLAKFLGLTKANTTGLVDRLVKKGLVDRRHGEEDRRTVYVWLTSTGQRAARKLAAVHREGLAQMMRRVPDKNLAVFIETLDAMVVGMSQTQKDLLPPPKP